MKKIGTKANNPAANGMTERFHRQLNVPLTGTGCDFKCDVKLSLVLLDGRPTIKRNIGCCAAELFYEGTLRLPGELLDRATDIPANITNYVQQLEQKMESVRSV